MKRTLLSILLTFWLAAAGFSQGEFNNWYFGNLKVVTFNPGFPVLLTGSGMNGGCVTVNVSDSAGNVWFYSNGNKVYNRNNTTMPNGTGLLGGGGSFSQSVTTIQDPADDSSYFLLTSGAYSFTPTELKPAAYSVINMRLNGRLGDVVFNQKNVPLNHGQKGYSSITGTRHKNNRDAWVVVKLMDVDSNWYAAYKITSTGIANIPVFSSSKLFAHEPTMFSVPSAGEIKISPDGTKLATVFYGDTLEIGDFDPETGMFHSRFITPLKISGVGIGFSQVEFSTDSKLLYAAGTGSGSAHVYQYDLTTFDSLAFVQSVIDLGATNGGHAAIQMAPDWKIYGTKDAHDSLWVVNSPSVRGTGCGFNPNGFCMQNWFHSDGLPQFVQRYKAYIHHTGDCQNSFIHFSGDIWPPPDSVHWDFGDPTSGAANYSNLTTPSHVYTNTGSYTVELFVRHNDNRTDTSWQTITILAGPQVNLGSDKTICAGNSYTFDAGACTGCSYEWKDVSSGLVVGTNQALTTSIAGEYGVIITNANGCTGKDTVQLFTTPVPQVTNTDLTKSFCSGENTNISLTSDVPGATFLWTCTLTSGTVSGFSSDSGLVINQTLVNSGSTPGIVTYHVTPRVGSCSGDLVNFQVTINPGENVNITIATPVNNVCSGTSVTFTATPTNPGSLPLYQWKVNAVNAINANNAVYTYTPLNGDIVTCVLTSSNTICTANNPATSNPITMIVTQPLPVSVTISATSNPVCIGTAVTFTAAPNNEGLTPVYQWRVNAVNAINANNAVYTYIPVNGDLVECILTSSEICTSGNPASSNPILMTVNSQIAVGVTITVTTNPVCEGTPVTFSANPTNPGGTPIYQWKLNDADAGINSQFYTMTPANNDQVKCILTSSMSCVTGNPTTSLPILMNVAATPAVTFTPCFDTITTTNAKPIKLKGGIPYGGTYSGPGVTAGYFYPNLAGAGTKIISYSYTNVANCTASSTVRIINYQLSIFNCGSSLTDIRDNKVYPTVQIGTQCWMQANLDFGTTINELTNQTDNCIIEKYTPNSSLLTPNSFYQWDEVMDYNNTPGGKGLCPPGWHVPDETEWNTLFNFYQGNARAGYPLQDQFLNGFKAQQNGVFYLNSMWSFTDFATLFWSSTMADQTRAYAHGMNTIDQSVSVYAGGKANGFSVRCLKD